MRDCSSCPQWIPYEETCGIADFHEYDEESFSEFCPKENGDWEEYLTANKAEGK